MTAAWFFAVGTLATWVGWIALFRTIALAVRFKFPIPGQDTDRVRRSLVIAGVTAGIGLLLGNTLPMDLGRPVIHPSSPHLPVVWFAMGAPAWLSVVGAVMVVLRAIQGWIAVTREEAAGRFWAAGIWLLVTLGFAAWHLQSDTPIEIIRGQIAMSWGLAVSMLTLAAVTVVAMTLAARKVSGRGHSRALVTHAALLVGCVVFGLPFAWMLITSFKEDKDLTAINGIIWVPRISETAAYDDPKNPQFEAEVKGQTVLANRLKELAPDRWLMEISEPLGLRGNTFETAPNRVKEVPRQVPVVEATFDGKTVKAKVVEELDGGDRRVKIMEPAQLRDVEFVGKADDFTAVRHVGLNVKNYPDSLAYLPPETNFGLVYLKNTLILVILSVIGTLLSCSIVAYAFSRMRFPGKGVMFAIMLSTMMLPGAVTLLPTFLIFRSLGWIDTLYPLWVPAFFAGAFNVFLLRQFFMTIPMELEDAAKIDGCSYLRTYWQVMIPQVKPALAAIAIWTFMGAWNNFMGPLIYINSPENMPIAYAVQLFQGQRGGEQHLMMAFATMAMLPVLLLFFFAQKYFIEGVTLSGLGGR